MRRRRRRERRGDRHGEPRRIDCLADVGATAAACVETATCGDALAACTEAFVLGVFACPQPQQEVLDALSATCGAPDADLFECGSGELLPQRFACDGEVDCADGSDETDC